MLLGGLIIVIFVAILNVTPLTFFTMLFLGNLGVHLGFIDLLPGAFAVYCIRHALITYNR